jgi:hypothetical protein
MQTWALLDLSLDSSPNHAVGRYRLHMRFHAPDRDGQREAEFDTALNPIELDTLEWDVVQYGQTLYSQLRVEREAEVFFSRQRPI